MGQAAAYEPPTGNVGLKGAVKRPEPGTLPLRGDLAHIALAERYLAAHYVIPTLAKIGATPQQFHLQPRDDAKHGASVAAHQSIEILDLLGDWCWACFGPEGPSGYLKLSALDMIEDASE